MAPPQPPPWNAFWERRERLWLCLFGSLLGGPLVGALLMMVSRPLTIVIAVSGVAGFILSGFLLGSVPCHTMWPPFRHGSHSARPALERLHQPL
jgi:predicted lipid-binding transport protein (Tim44 family)